MQQDRTGEGRRRRVLCKARSEECIDISSAPSFLLRIGSHEPTLKQPNLLETNSVMTITRSNTTEAAVSSCLSLSPLGGRQKHSHHSMFGHQAMSRKIGSLIDTIRGVSL